MAEEQTGQQIGVTATAEPYRIDVKLHDILMEPQAKEVSQPASPGQKLPEPVYPQRAYSDETDPTLKEYQRTNAVRTWHSWGKSYFASRSLKNRKELRPIIAYLFTDYKCNLDCHYCWAYNNAVKGMTEETARQSIDWLESMGNRVLALMGGEPLLRPDFVHKITDYAAKKGFFVYLPTNGRLMRPDVIDKLGDAGMATINLAIDSVAVKPSLPNALVEALTKPRADAEPPAPSPAASSSSSSSGARDQHECPKCGKNFVVVYAAPAGERTTEAPVACPHCWQVTKVPVAASAAQHEDYRAEAV